MYILSRSAFVGRYIDCRNMCGMRNIKFKKTRFEAWKAKSFYSTESLEHNRTLLCGCELDSSDSGQGPMAGYFEKGTVMKRGFRKRSTEFGLAKRLLNSEEVIYCLD
jgi:hypothetical protein